MSDISPEALDVLTRSTTVGQMVRLPDCQLDRKLYAEVDKVLSNLGGKWSRRDRAHIFASDPAEALAAAVGGGQVPKHPDKVAAFFPTPHDVATLMVSWAGSDPTIEGGRWLEPSAGDGAIARVVREMFPSAVLACVETDRGRAEQLAPGTIYEQTFQSFAAENPSLRFDAVVMNPPFTEPGKPLAWVEHVGLAFDLLRSGGRLAAIVPASVSFGQRKAIVELRKRLDWESLTCEIEPLPEGTFRVAGTDAQTALILAVKL